MPEDKQANGASSVSEKVSVSRRDVVRLAAAGSMAGAGVITADQARAAAKGRWTHEADVVVVGTGAAGLTAALIASKAGRSVIVLEKMPLMGGTTNKSGGVYWIPNNSLMRAQGLVDEKADCLRYMARTAFPMDYNASAPKLGITDEAYALLETLYDQGENAVAALGAMGAVKTGLRKQGDGQMWPDYWPKLQENKAPIGRGLVPVPPDGKQPSGAELIRQLKAAVEARKIPVLMEHRAERLVVNARGEIIGLQAVNDGKKVAIRARRGVIFGSGGFIQNPQLCKQFLRGPVFGGCGAPGSEGDFIAMAGALGAQFGNMSQAWWGQVILEEALRNRSVGTAIWSISGDSMVMVNGYGRRCVDEKGTYNERTQAHFQWDMSRVGYSNAIQFVIYDDACRQKFGTANDVVVKPGLNPPHLLSGATIEDLARAIDRRLAQIADRTGGFRLDPEFVANLKITIERFNGFAATGEDLDFRRGQSWSGTQWVPFGGGVNGVHTGVPATPPPRNISMAPLSKTGPYYAVMMGGGALDTKGGPKVNTRAQVVNYQNQPIPGLYGAGNCIASPANQAYWAGGGTIGPAITFGYLAGLNAAAEPVKAEA